MRTNSILDVTVYQFLSFKVVYFETIEPLDIQNKKLPCNEKKTKTKNKQTNKQQHVMKFEFNMQYGNHKQKKT